ncbi:hypothetical protein VTL71DRAFT_10086 [Oculimacula yallundae]|uniref:Short-chain dehydrogenase n=1 Tax=Oculimacula yallundae TaxID=86028 RepID=A0ABR4BRR6_9HELO
MPPVSLFSAAFPPSPKFTEKNLPSLTGKTYIITGSASGVGYELAKILYLAGGTVYIAARSEERCRGAIEKIVKEAKEGDSGGCKKGGKGKAEGGEGRLESLVVDLSDLRSVRKGVEDFLRREQRLDGLWHNAAVMTPPVGSLDKLGHDLEMGTNCLAPYLMTMLLEPILIRTAGMPGSVPNSVRVVFVVSMLTEGSVDGGAMSFDKNGTPTIITTKFMANYMQSKNGGVWLALHFAERLGKHGILSVSLHPGLMRTELQRHWNVAMKLAMSVATKGPVYGAYSELYAGFSPEITQEHNGELTNDVKEGWKSKESGGTGASKKFLEYCDREAKEFL